MVPSSRVRALNNHGLHPAGEWVVYWMIQARRLNDNFALDRAIELAHELQRPLLICEPLAVDDPWASDRFHRFVLDGMREHDEALRGGPVRYYPYVERDTGAGRGLLATLATRACAVVTDDAPTSFRPRILTAAAAAAPVRFEAVDSYGLVPLRATNRAFPTAHGFRRWLHGVLPAELSDVPNPDPLADLTLPRARLAAAIGERWPEPTGALLRARPAALARLPIDHGVQPVDGRSGGGQAAARRLAEWTADDLARYEAARHPDDGATSRLSPYLHFGHLGVHQVLRAVARVEDWNPGQIDPAAAGKRRGWWGMSAAAQGFLDELVTWRELCANTAVWLPKHESFESLPSWARETLAAHAGDARTHHYPLADFAAAATHDPIWNAAQRELLTEGSMHNYLRMLWGKKILEWTASPEEALTVMWELNNRYALDGRDPNSTGGIFWVLGRYDRGWGPERPVFGKIRFMSSAQARRKLRMQK